MRNEKRPMDEVISVKRDAWPELAEMPCCCLPQHTVANGMLTTRDSWQPTDWSCVSMPLKSYEGVALAPRLRKRLGPLTSVWMASMSMAGASSPSRISRLTARHYALTCTHLKLEICHFGLRPRHQLKIYKSVLRASTLLTQISSTCC